MPGLPCARAAPYAARSIARPVPLPLTSLRLGNWNAPRQPHPYDCYPAPKGAGAGSGGGSGANSGPVGPVEEEYGHHDGVDFEMGEFGDGSPPRPVAAPPSPGGAWTAIDDEIAVFEEEIIDKHSVLEPEEQGYDSYDDLEHTSKLQQEYARVKAMEIEAKARRDEANETLETWDLVDGIDELTNEVDGNVTCGAKSINRNACNYTEEVWLDILIDYHAIMCSRRATQAISRNNQGELDGKTHMKACNVSVGTSIGEMSQKYNVKEELRPILT